MTSFASTELGTDRVYANEVIPVVYVNRMLEDQFRILPDDRYGVELALQYLKKMGHTDIGFINGPDVYKRQVLAQPEVTIHVVPASLPKQKFLHTEWFYPDCLADYYGVEVYSEEHWNMKMCIRDSPRT